MIASLGTEDEEVMSLRPCVTVGDLHARTEKGMSSVKSNIYKNAPHRCVASAKLQPNIRRVVLTAPTARGRLRLVSAPEGRF